MTSIPFTKMSGSGNDFILIDNRNRVISEPDLAGFAARICRRRYSVGADGLILLENSDRVDFKWEFFNSDGSIAEMCGNGARCAARFALLNGIATENMRFETIAGIIHAQVLDDQVKIKMTNPTDLLLNQALTMDSHQVHYSSVNTGVPHVVIQSEDVESVDVVGIGRGIRHHPDFFPAGTNVNFLGLQSDNIWAVRTYERGVEGETLACGTGIVACALVLAQEKGIASPVSLRSKSNSLLKVYFSPGDQGFEDVYLEGDAQVIYIGKFSNSQ